METQDKEQPIAGQTVTPTASQPSPPPAGKPASEEEPQVELGAETDMGDTIADSGQASDDGSADDGPAVSWTASEFIDHDKRAGWYAVLGLSALAFAGLVYLISRDIISVSVVLVAALVFGIYAGHKPRQIEYRMDASGLGIGQKHFHWGDFRSFSVMEEGAVPSIVFMPLKRFAVPTTIYYPPEEEDKIVGILTELLPMEQRGHDAIDRLMHRIRY